MQRLICIAGISVLVLGCADQTTNPDTPVQDRLSPESEGAVVLDRRAPPAGVLKLLFGEARRTSLGGGLAHYEFEVPLGPGEFDVVRIHRVVKERRPYRPMRANGAVFMVHGASQNFVDIYMLEGEENPDPLSAVAGFLADRGIDVWGIDLAWTLIPASNTDFTSMPTWDVDREVDHILASMSIARLLRGLSGLGFDRMNLLGFSYSVGLVYAAAARETTEHRLSRDIAGLIAVDGILKFDRSTDIGNQMRLASCAEAAGLGDQIDAGVFHNAQGSLFSFLGQLAGSAPHEPSPLPPFAGLTNLQALLAVITAPNPAPAPDWHFAGGVFEGGIPVGLLYGDVDVWIRLAATLPPYMPDVSGYELRTSECDDEDVAFDDHVGDIAVPILYIGAGGGLGELGLFAATLTASDDVTNLMASVQPPDLRFIDFGHGDLFTARNAPELVWEPLHDWLVDHDGPERGRGWGR